MEKAEKDRKQKLSFRFVPTRHVIENSKKIVKNNSENLKIPLWLHFKPLLVGIDRQTGKIKTIITFGSNPKRNRKFIKKLQKKFKKLEKTVMASFQAKIGWKWPRKRQK